jgi:hypothetical protein
MYDGTYAKQSTGYSFSSEYANEITITGISYVFVVDTARKVILLPPGSSIFVNAGIESTTIIATGTWRIGNIFSYEGEQISYHLEPPDYNPASNASSNNNYIPTAGWTPSISITAVPSPSPTPTISITPTRTPTPTISITPTRTPASTIGVTPTITPTTSAVSVTPTVTVTPTPTRTPTPTTSTAAPSGISLTAPTIYVSGLSLQNKGSFSNGNVYNPYTLVMTGLWGDAYNYNGYVQYTTQWELYVSADSGGEATAALVATNTALQTSLPTTGWTNTNRDLIVSGTVVISTTP